MENKKRTAPISEKFDKSTVFEVLRSTARLAVQGHKAALETLWQAQHGIARHLACIGDQNARTINRGLLTEILQRGIHMLVKRMSKNDPSALEELLELAECCCDYLKEAADRDPEFVAKLAERRPFWPVMLGRKRLYHDLADSFLTKVRAGTKSIPPTTPKTNIEANDRWTRVALELLGTTFTYRRILSREKARTRSDGPITKKIETELRITEAKFFPEVLGLPTQFDRKSKSKYWAVAKQMLKARWKRNPAEEDDAVKAVGSGHDESDRAYAIRRVRTAFYTLAG